MRGPEAIEKVPTWRAATRTRFFPLAVGTLACLAEGELEKVVGGAVSTFTTWGERRGFKGDTNPQKGSKGETEQDWLQGEKHWMMMQ
jgi:hypothetical protein